MFKVGDRVRVLDIPGCGLLTKRATGVIYHIDTMGCFVTMDCDHSTRHSRFSAADQVQWALYWENVESPEYQPVGTFPFCNPGKGRV